MSFLRQLLFFFRPKDGADKIHYGRKEYAIAGYLIPDKLSLCANDEIVLVDESIIINFIEFSLSMAEAPWVEKGYELMEVLRCKECENPEVSYIKRYRMSAKEVKHFFEGVETLPIHAFLIGTH